MTITELLESWKGRAEKAEAELARVQAAAAEMREALIDCERELNFAPRHTKGQEFDMWRSSIKKVQKALSSSAGTGYARKEDVVPLVAAIESAVKNCFFCRGTGAISKAADRMSADPPPLPHECQDCKPLREALAKAKGLTE